MACKSQSQALASPGVTWTFPWPRQGLLGLDQASLSQNQMEIHPYVLQEIGPLGLLPKKGHTNVITVRDRLEGQSYSVCDIV